MPVSKKQQGHVNKYVQSHYDRIIVTVPKGAKDEIKEAACSAGYDSVNAFIREAIDEKMASMKAKEKPV